MNIKNFFQLIVVILLLSTTQGHSAISDWQQSHANGAKVRILGSSDDNDTIILGVEFEISNGWKIYGHDDSGIGLPPSFNFNGSKNYQNHKVLWPTPIKESEQIGDEKIEYSVYKDKVIIPVEITPQDDDLTTEISVKIDYGLCNEVCIPASHSFSLNILDEEDEEALSIIKNEEEDDDSLELSRLITYIAIALIGGAILNIMPCVLPVLSIKLLSIIKHSKAKKAKIRFAFLSTICGILSCFILFAIIASIIQHTGNSLGWGFQFQSPYFLIFLILILVTMSGNLLGIFEISFDQTLASLLNKKIEKSEKQKNIFIPNFLSGVLAVLLATPCSAPFLGSAISFALTQNSAIIFIMLIAIGVGFALPYIILIFAPHLVQKLPKPGAWMIKVKKVMAAFLIITSLWLVYTLSNNIGMIAAIAALCITSIITISFRIELKFLKNLVIVALTGIMFCLPLNLKETTQIKQEDEIWIEFSEESLNYLVSEGNVVVVDITADWCLTCKLNKVRVLNSKEIKDRLKSPHIFAMRADITKPNKEVMDFMAKYNRYAIPFNAVYGPKAKEGLLTSEFLGKNELLQLIKQAK